MREWEVDPEFIVVFNTRLGFMLVFMSQSINTMLLVFFFYFRLFPFSQNTLGVRVSRGTFPVRQDVVVEKTSSYPRSRKPTVQSRELNTVERTLSRNVVKSWKPFVCYSSLLLKNAILPLPTLHSTLCVFFTLFFFSKLILIARNVCNLYVWSCFFALAL